MQKNSKPNQRPNQGNSSLGRGIFGITTHLAAQLARGDAVAVLLLVGSGVGGGVLGGERGGVGLVTVGLSLEQQGTKGQSLGYY